VALSCNGLCVSEYAGTTVHRIDHAVLGDVRQRRDGGGISRAAQVRNWTPYFVGVHRKEDCWIDTYREIDFEEGWKVGWVAI
jgi:hypothetical protein